MTVMGEWTAQVCTALGLAPEVINERLVLDLARDVAHGVARPAAPLTAYLLGVAVGGGADQTEAARIVTGLARHWPPGDQAG